MLGITVTEGSARRLGIGFFAAPLLLLLGVGPAFAQTWTITSPGEAYGHHGACQGWNGCGDAVTCALHACQANGFSTLVSYGAEASCTSFDVCHLFYDVTQDDAIQCGWGNWCDVAGVTDIVCSGPTGCSDGVCGNSRDGLACEDGLFCSVDDVCSGGTCGGAPRDCSASGDQCQVGACDEGAGSCVGQPKPDGTACDDEDACTSQDTCEAGSCGGTATLEDPLSDLDQTLECVEQTLGNVLAE